MRFDLSPLYRSTVGFDSLASMLDQVASFDEQPDNYPPYNIERLIDGFNGVVASRLDSVEFRERKRAQESYRCKCCSFWQRLLSSLEVLFKDQSDHYTHIWGRSTLGSVRLLRMEWKPDGRPTRTLPTRLPYASSRDDQLEAVLCTFPSSNFPHARHSV